MKIIAFTERNIDAIVEAANKNDDMPPFFTIKMDREWCLSIIRKEDARGRQPAYFAVNYIMPERRLTDTWAVLPHDFAKSYYSGDFDSALEGWVEVTPSNTIVLNQE